MDIKNADADPGQELFDKILDLVIVLRRPHTAGPIVRCDRPELDFTSVVVSVPIVTSDLHERFCESAAISTRPDEFCLDADPAVIGVFCDYVDSLLPPVRAHFFECSPVICTKKFDERIL